MSPATGAKSRSAGSKPRRTKKNTNNTIARSVPTPVTQAVPPKEPRIHGATAARRAARNATNARHLAAVSGVVIPSKVSPGQIPDQGHWDENKRKIHPCSICGRKFVRRHQVNSHMWACVNRNGNPNGARWDDAWSNGATQAASVNVQPNDQVLHMKDTQSEDSQAEDDGTEGNQTEEDQNMADEPAGHQSEYYQPEHPQSEDHEPADLPFPWPSKKPYPH